MVLKQLLNNLRISLDGPCDCIVTHVSIKVIVYIQKNIYYIYNYVHKLCKNVCSNFCINVGNDYSLKDYSKKKTFNSASNTNQIYGDDFIYKIFSTCTS